jgi:hypothetical protein
MSRRRVSSRVPACRPRRGPPTPHRHRASCLVVALLLAAGCGRRVEPVAEPERATALLETVLAGWRDGATCDELRRRSPPIHVADERWLGGAALESYTIGPGRPFGPSTRFEVTLVGPAPLGTRRAVYIVSTQPVRSVTLGE